MATTIRWRRARCSASTTRPRPRTSRSIPTSIGFLTYYAAHGINYRVPPLPQFETLDVPYLGTVILDLAGLPLSDSHKERKRLMAAVQGALLELRASATRSCMFHRRLIDSGVMAAR